MRVKQLREKYDTLPAGVQVQSASRRREAIIFAFAAMAVLDVTPAAAQGGSSTSPLQILQQAPKVRFDEREATPPPAMTPALSAPRDPIPYVPPSGPAPYVEPVYPAITPYAGNRVGAPPASPQRDPYYGAPAPGMTNTPPAATPPRYIGPGPTPRPVLGPEDVQPKEKKRGFVRGLINAIPFVGDDDEEQQTPAQTPTASRPDVAEEPIYRGYDAAPSAGSSPDGPILLPPGAAPVRGSLPSDPEPSSPPIMTPEPRGGVAPQNLDSMSDTLPGESPARGEAPVTDRPILTVKREGDSTATRSTPAADPLIQVEPDTQPVGPTERKQPSIAPETLETPKPLERATTSVIIQNSREPEPDDTLGPRPDPSATTLEPFDPTRPKPEPEPEVDDVATTLSVQQSDLGMPNPTYEQNAVILAEFQEAVRKARAEDYAEASRMFREYGQNHPSSGLAPRAYFLSVIFEKDRKQARENVETMKRLFPESRYVKDVADRRPDLSPAAATAVASAEAVPNETPRQKVDRLERELTAAVGDTTREPALRKDLGLAYLELEEYDRAYEVLRPAVEMSSGQPIEAEVLLATGRVLAARRETVQAISLYEAVEQKNPELIYSDAGSAWSVGLAYEGVGKYTKARTIYNTIRQKWPATPEAGWATTRLNELAALAQ